LTRIVVLGAGTGGTLLANLLVRHLSKRVEAGESSVHLIGEGQDHSFQPANLDIAFKGADPQKFLRRETHLLNHGVQYMAEGAQRVDLGERVIEMRSGAKLPYDYLVFATGALASPELMPGLSEGSLNFHTGPYNAVKIWDAIQRLKGGKVVVAITSVPHKCPPSPNEAAFMLDEFFRSRGLRESVELKFLTPYPRAYPAEHISQVVQPMFEERHIEVVPFFATDYVDPADKKIYSLEGESQDYDLLIAVPPHRGADVVRASGIGGNDGWIPTDKRTMRMKDRREVYALGDATDIPISKSGVVAHLQADIVAHNLLSDLAGGQDSLEYNGRINCPMETGHRRALFVSGTYDVAPGGQEPTFVRYVMKRSFSRMYWSALRGSWGWLFDVYFGETSHPAGQVAAKEEERVKPTAA
jgi:sulfide:quinone oxidoreductase